MIKGGVGGNTTLTGLNFENKENGAKAKALLPPVLKDMWEAQIEHNRKIGWLK